MNLIEKYKYILAPKQKMKVIFFLFCSIVGAAMELLSVSLMIPLVMALLDASLIRKIPILKEYGFLFSEYSRHDVIFTFLMIFLLVVVGKNVFVYATKVYRRDFIVTSNYKTCAKLFNMYLHCDYEDILKKNSDEIIRNIVYVTNHTYLLLEAFLELLGELVIVVFLLMFLLFINWRVTVILFIFLTGLLLLYRNFSGRRLQKIGAESNRIYLRAMECVREAILGFKEIELLHREKAFFDYYAKNHRYNVRLEKEKVFYQLAPAHVTEVCVFTALCVYIGIAVSLDADMTALVTELSVISLSALRMIPSVNRINQNANLVSLYRPSLEKISREFLQCLKKEDAGRFIELSPLPFQQYVELKDVCYKYPGTETDILRNINLKIEKGSKVGLIGVSGGGKTTLADIMLGYLKPYQGHVLVDGRDISENIGGWMLNIGYIPQMIFLVDGTIRENILLGDESADEDKIWRSLEMARLSDFVIGLPEGLDTEIGERGIRLSGGQRQRIGIARALYNDSRLLVLDEATSALDKETEADLMRAVYALDKEKTVLIIAHDRSTLADCDFIYCVKDKGLERWK